MIEPNETSPENERAEGSNSHEHQEAPAAMRPRGNTVPPEDSEVYKVAQMAATEYEAKEKSEVEKVFDLSIQSELYIGIRALTVFALCDDSMLKRSKQQIAEQMGYASPSNFYTTCRKIKALIERPEGAILLKKIESMRQKLGIVGGQSSASNSVALRSSTTAAVVGSGVSIPEQIRDGLTFYVMLRFPGVTPEDLALAYGMSASLVQQQIVDMFMYLRDRKDGTGEGVLHLLKKIKAADTPL